MMKHVEVSNEARLPTRYGEFRVMAFKEHEKEHLAIYTENIRDNGCGVPLVRVHSECLTGDVMSSLKCDCGEQLQKALEMIAAEGCGMVLYLRQEGRNIGLLNKINAYHLQDQGMDTVEANHQLGFAADERSYEIAEFMLEHFGIKKIRLLTNNPNKLDSFDKAEITERVPLIVASNVHNEGYLRTKREKTGHLL